VLISLQSSSHTDVGPHRSTNQDSAFTSSWGAAVADGVGGGPAGDLASGAIIHRFAASLHAPLDAEELLTRLRVANWDLRAHVERDRSLAGMATTFTGIFPSRHGGLLLAHTGDSRAYRLRGGVLARQTRDDSVVQVLVDRGLMTPQEAAQHPQRNVITASLHGGEDDVIAIAEVAALPGDRWLLCSDGVSDYLADSELAALVDGSSAEDAAASVVRHALDAGSRDNVTAVVCDIVSADHGSPGTQFSGAALSDAFTVRP
jgi:protein phosphatase